MDPAPLKQQEFMILYWVSPLHMEEHLAFTPRILVAKIPFQVIQNKPHFSALDTVSAEDNH